MWKPIDPNRVRNVGGESVNRLAYRVYGWEGKLFPRLVVNIYQTPTGDCISCSEKRSGGAWWQTTNIPSYILPVVGEMIQEVVDGRV